MRALQTTDGHQYKGLFYCMKETEQGEMHMVLSHASHNDEQETIPYAVIPYNVFQSMAAEEIDLAGQDISATPFTAVAGFEDTANAAENAGYVAPFLFTCSVPIMNVAVLLEPDSVGVCDSSCVAEMSGNCKHSSLMRMLLIRV